MPFLILLSNHNYFHQFPEPLLNEILLLQFLLNHSVNHDGNYAPRNNFLNTYDSLAGQKMYQNDFSKRTRVCFGWKMVWIPSFPIWTSWLATLMAHGQSPREISAAGGPRKLRRFPVRTRLISLPAPMPPISNASATNRRCQSLRRLPCPICRSLPQPVRRLLRAPGPLSKSCNAA